VKSIDDVLWHDPIIVSPPPNVSAPIAL